MAKPRVTLVGAGPGTLRGDGFAGPALIVIGDVVRFARSSAAESSAKAA